MRPTESKVITLRLRESDLKMLDWIRNAKGNRQSAVSLSIGDAIRRLIHLEYNHGNLRQGRKAKDADYHSEHRVGHPRKEIV